MQLIIKPCVYVSHHQQLVDNFDSTPQVKLQQNQLPTFECSPVSHLSFSDMLEPQMSTTDQQELGF